MSIAIKVLFYVLFLITLAAWIGARGYFSSVVKERGKWSAWGAQRNGLLEILFLFLVVFLIARFFRWPLIILYALVFEAIFLIFLTIWIFVRPSTSSSSPYALGYWAGREIGARHKKLVRTWLLLNRTLTLAYPIAIGVVYLLIQYLPIQ